MLKGLRLRVGLRIFSWGSGGRCKPPSGSRAEPWWGSKGRSSREPLNFRVFHHVNIAILRGSVPTIFKV